MKIRTVTPQDTEALTQLLNDVIGAGGTTAIETPLTPAEFSEWFISGSNALSCRRGGRWAVGGLPGAERR